MGGGDDFTARVGGQGAGALSTQVDTDDEVFHPQLTAFFTSALILASSAGVSSFSA